MAEIANRSFIEGYCNVYNSTFTFHLYLNGSNADNKQQITVNTDANGYWRYKLGMNKLYRLQEAFTNVSQSESDKLLSVRFHCDMSYLDSIYFMCYNNSNIITARNISTIEGLVISNNSTYNIAYRYAIRGTNITSFSLNGWSNAVAQNAQGMFQLCRNIRTITTDDNTAMKISNANSMFAYCNWLGYRGDGGHIDLSFVWCEFSQDANLYYMFRECFCIRSNPQDGIFDLSRFSFSNTIANMFYATQAIIDNWYNTNDLVAWEDFTHIALPTLLDGCDVTNAFLWLIWLKEITACGNIGAIVGSLTFEKAESLSLNSAKLVLSKLQDLQGGSATIAFSSGTSALVQADTTAMNLVAQAQANGWTITFN